MKPSVKNSPAQPAEQRGSSLPGIFAALFGALLGLTLVKFGNPITMEKLIEQPQSPFEWLLNPWPVAIGYALLVVVTIVGLAVARWKTTAPKWLLILPIVWLGWQLLATAQSEVVALSKPTLVHFVTCVICFGLGLFALSPIKKLGWFWAFVVAGFCWVLVVGFEQHFGGLASSRKYWFLYVYPTLTNVPPDLFKKMSSERIFGTLFYPNTLAGVILLLLPVTLALLSNLRQQFTASARGFLMAVAAGAALACLVWSGSKGGWLLMLVVGVVGAMYLPWRRQLKIWLVVGVMVVGLAGFSLRYFGYFKKGATSVTARYDYWRAAVQVVKDKPVFGAGPGTFAKAYGERKRPEAEMAKLTHNDYLEQASDSGVVGGVAYTAWVIGSLIYIWRKGRLEEDRMRLAVWLGLLGWAIQSFMEFGLYIPAIAWVAFGLMGWLMGDARGKTYLATDSHGFTRIF